MLKTLEQLNREFMEKCQLLKMAAEPDVVSETIVSNEPVITKADGTKETLVLAPSESIYTRLIQAEQDKREKKRKIIKRITDVALCTTIVFILIITVIFNGHSNKRFSLFGYSGFTVLSESMQSEIPEGSLVLVKKADADNINVGDDITFIRKKDDSAVIHRVVSIYISYGENGGKGFQTQGIENSTPDQDIIYADDIIGIVTLVIPGLGYVLNYIFIDIGFLILVCGGLYIAVIIIRKLVPRNSKRK